MKTIIDFLFYSVRAGTPLLFGTTGEILTEKSGSMNLGVEGMMAMGAIGGYLMGTMTDSFILALLFAFLSAALGGLIFAFLTITMQANQNVTGLALTIFGVGLYRFVGTTLQNKHAFPSLSAAKKFSSAVMDKGIPVLRDIPYVGKLLFSYNWFVYIGAAVAIIMWIYIVRTRPGLRMRAIGENPGAADSCGVNVNLSKYLHIIVGAGVCGLGGLYQGVIVNGGGWNASWINGAGWISVALVIFANWSPIRTIAGAYFFGMLNTLKPWGGNLVSAFPKVFGWIGKIPGEFYDMLPFLITAIILVLSGVRSHKKSEEPTAIGLNYFREER